MQTSLSIGKAAKLIGVSLSTMYRWIKSGKIKENFRTFGHHRRFLLKDIQHLIKMNMNDKKVIAYARVSTQKQKNDLENKKKFLHNYCVNNNFNNFEVISDLGSGLSFNKKGLNKLIHLITSQSISKIILNNSIEKSSEQEFSEELCEIITVFSARLYGKRSHKNTTDPLK